MCVLPPLVALERMRTELVLTLPPLTPDGRLWRVTASATVSVCGGGALANVTLAHANLTLWSGDALADGGGEGEVVAIVARGADGGGPSETHATAAIDGHAMARFDWINFIWLLETC